MALKVVEPARRGGGSSLVVNLPQVKSHPAVKTFIRLADDYLGELGYTEHGFRHAKIVARDARNLLKGLGYEKRVSERAAIAGYLHDMGNFISRAGHPQSGAAISYQILGELGMPYKDAETFDIHDRVNYAAESSVLSVDAEKRTLTLELTIDTDMCKIMEYFEIFLERMAMCRRAAEFLDCQFRLVINGTEVL
jgi:metal-dependent HD superfamily phosphatase/phosphodiesterase